MQQERFAPGWKLGLKPILTYLVAKAIALASSEESKNNRSVFPFEKVLWSLFCSLCDLWYCLHAIFL